MRILLVSIIHSYKYGNTGVDYIANYIRQSCKTASVDIKYYHHFETWETIINDLHTHDSYDIYGFSIFETNYVLSKKIAEYLKRTQSCLVVFGGQFVTMNYREIVSDAPMVDYFILGDGEAPMLRIIHSYGNKTIQNDENIAAMHDIEDKKANVEQDINRKASFDYYTQDTAEANMQKTHCMMTKSNVCTGACTFCCSRKGRVVYKEPERVVEEIAYLATTFGVKKFFICDDDLFDIDGDENRERLMVMFEKIDRLNFNLAFSGFAKPKAICNPRNYEVLQKMNKIGFHHLFLGIDAGNEWDRKLYNKRATLEEGKRALQILDDIGISPRYGMIFFNPYSTLDSLRKSYQYLIELHSTNYYHYGGLRVQVLNGTKLKTMLQQDHLLDREYSFLNTQAYRFKDPSIQPIADFMADTFIPAADAVTYQFNTLKRKFELVRHINRAAEKYAPLVHEYGEREFEAIKKFFYYLYVQQDVMYCQNHMNDFITSMKRNAEVYQPIIRKLDEMFISTPLKK
ncbi:cobalamin-dependent protein [Megasphaera sp. SW808]|uniref:B12-binding domain-containing radical SAM protein n=1 Tax=Megasphaera sp. SW808 TaxID=2530045 RepID=UPI00143AFDBE|nr:cobalamin-dependent protein [Megasphaera sp. SW808]